MSAPSSCPDRTLLVSLLSGTSENGEHAALIGHLDECPSCRQALEELAGAADVSPTALAELDQPSQPDEPKLAGALDALKATPPDEQPHPELDFALDFLEPSDNPTHLGRFASYEITEELGRGGHGVVLKGFDPALHRVVAIKVLAPVLATNATARKRFAREARAAAAVTHDHVVAIHAVDEWRNLPYLVMQYISGVSLQERIHREGPLEVKEVLRIGMQVASGLAAAHAQGLVHRDIKPSNVLLENGVARVKITDFALARAVDDAALTQSGVVAGTPQYMAPEQARGEPLDHRADLFSLGSVLYAMCTGRPPFRTDTTMAVLRKVSDETPTPIRQINADIPDWLAEIVARLHAKDPAARYQTAAEVAAVLGRHLEHLQHPCLVQQPSSPPYQGGEGGGQSIEHPAARPKPRRTWLAAAAVVLVVLALGITEVTGVTDVTDFVATVLRIRTPDGTLVVQVGDPAIEVTVEDGGKAITLTGAGPHTIRLTPGRHQIDATRNGQPLPTQWVTLTRGGKQVVSVSLEADRSDAQAVAKPLPTIRPFATLVADLKLVQNVAFSPDGKKFATAGGEGQVKIWDFETRQLVHTVELIEALGKGPLDYVDVYFAQFSPDGGQLVTAATPDPSREQPGAVEIWDIQSGKRLREISFSKAPAVALSKDATLLALGGATGSVKLLDLSHGQEDGPATSLDGVGEASGLAFSPDATTLAVVRGSDLDAAHEITLYDTRTRRELKAFTHQGRVMTLLFSSDGQTLITAGTISPNKGSIRLWNIPTGESTEVIDGRSGPVLFAAVSPDNRTLAGGGGRVVTVQPIAVLPGGSATNLAGEPQRPPFAELCHADPVNSVAFSPDSKVLASGDAHGTVKLWDVAAIAGSAASDQAPLPPPRSTKPVVGIPVDFRPKGQPKLDDHGDEILVRRFYDVSDLVTVPTPKPVVVTITLNKERLVSVGGGEFIDLGFGQTALQAQVHAKTLLGDPQSQEPLPFDKLAVSIGVEEGPREVAKHVFKIIEECQQAGFRNFLQPRHPRRGTKLGGAELVGGSGLGGGGLLGSYDPPVDFPGDDSASKFLRDFDWFDLHPSGSVEYLRRLIRSLVESSSWEDVGGPWSIEYVESPLHRLAVTASDEAHEAVERALDALRHPAALKIPAWRTALEQNLDQTVSIDFTDKPLQDAVAALREQTGLKIMLDQKLVADAQIDPLASVTAQLQNVSVAVALETLVEPLELTYLLRDEAVVLTTVSKAEENLEMQFYLLDPLLPRDATGKPRLDRERWTKLLQEFVQPVSWDNVGGPGSIVYYDPQQLMIVSQTQQVHRKIAAFLKEVQRQQQAGLRRDLPAAQPAAQPPRNAPPDAHPTTPAAVPEPEPTGQVRKLPAWRRHIEESLAKRVDVDFNETPLPAVAQWFRGELNANVVLDPRAQIEHPDVRVSLQMSGVPLRSALGQVLEPLNMEYLLRDETVVLTTSEQADKFIETQVHRVAHLLPAGPDGKPSFDADYWDDLLKELIEPKSWNDVGGRGVIMTNDARALLIISQTQPIHRKIAKLLEDMKAAPASEGRQPPDSAVDADANSPAPPQSEPQP